MNLNKKTVALLAVLGLLIIAGAVVYFRSGGPKPVEGSADFVQQMVKEAQETPPPAQPAQSSSTGRMQKKEE